MTIRLQKYCTNFVTHESNKSPYFIVYFSNPSISIGKIDFLNIFAFLCYEIIFHELVS